MNGPNHLGMCSTIAAMRTLEVDLGRGLALAAAGVGASVLDRTHRALSAALQVDNVARTGLGGDERFGKVRFALRLRGRRTQQGKAVSSRNVAAHTMS